MKNRMNANALAPAALKLCVICCDGAWRSSRIAGHGGQFILSQRLSADVESPVALTRRSSFT
jgi:hypothetical protein